MEHLTKNARQAQRERHQRTASQVRRWVLVHQHLQASDAHIANGDFLMALGSCMRAMIDGSPSQDLKYEVQCQEAFIGLAAAGQMPDALHELAAFGTRRAVDVMGRQIVAMKMGTARVIFERAQKALGFMSERHGVNFEELGHARQTA